MKQGKFTADLRLLIPVLTGWIVLACAVSLEAETKPPFVVFVFVLIAASICGALVLRKSPLLALSVFTVTALLGSWLLQLPTYSPSHPRDEVIDTSAPWWLAWADSLRSTFLTATSRFPSYGGELIPGLAIGDTSRVSEHLSESMKSVSLTHITAVSGANCAIVTASVMAVAALCGAGRKVRLILAICALLAFVVLVTPQPSVLRAAVMAIVVMISMYSGRPGSGIPLLSVATLLMLLWNPWWAIDFGFILSVSATAGLLLFSGPVSVRLNRWLPLWLATVIAVPLSAQLMCQPFIILLSPLLPTYGVLANIIAAPAAPLATVVGLIACIFSFFVPVLAEPLLWLSWLPAEWIGQTATVLAKFPAAQIPWLSGALGSVSAALGSVLLLLVLLSPHSGTRKVSSVILVSSVVMWAGVTLWGQLRFSASIPPGWSIATCDVGQGDALVIKSAQQIAVIDVGRNPEPLIRCLEQLQISHINLLVLTHFDKDHVGGLSAVLGKVDLAVVGKPENAEDQGLLEELGRSGAELIRGTQGLRGKLGDAQWQVLWPDNQHPTMELGNPGSVTLLVSFPRFRALFLGDLGKEAQLALMSSVDLPPVHVVKVAHHGSADQSSSFYQKINPQVGLFSVGAHNDYGHPRSETLAILSDLGALTPRTDQDGLILVSDDNSGLSVWTEH